jgi:DNA modification methylase
MIQGQTYTVHIGNNLDILPTLPDNSVDSIVTDPPYELGFMGKKWDSSGIAYSVELWRECLRVLKPGGHLLSFGGTRTWHRVAVGIEDAGFEVRDSIAWMYGSGFPKSLDVSKAIDKRGGQGSILTTQIGEALRQAREKRNISKSLADQMFCDGTTNWSWFEGRPAGQRPPTPETFTRIVAEWKELAPLAQLVAEAEREVIGSKKTGDPVAWYAESDRGDGIVDITAPSTPEAQQWEGWGTALKPAFEPIVVARKPLIGTVAENVLTHGTGALNIDGSRIQAQDAPEGRSRHGGGIVGNATSFELPDSESSSPAGRWPANVILDEYSAGLLDEQTANLKGATSRTTHVDRGPFSTGVGELVPDAVYGDSGGASRFFYCAKASKRDRNEGLEELDPQRHSDRENAEGVGGDNPRNRTNEAKQNFHPTVKPTQLMRYLVKLVTPPGGTVLDPFTGSGSTGKAAILEGFRFIGCELTEDYIPIIEGRLKHAELMKAEEEAKKEEALF